MKGTKELIKTEKPLALSPFEELERMERWFEDLWSRPFSLFRAPAWPGSRTAELEQISPSVDIYDEGNELVVKADVPGVKKEDLDLNVHENYLTILGHKRKEEKVEREDYYRFERSYGSFTRRFELPEGMDTEKIKAHFENGVLEVRIPRSEETAKKSKKITIE
ncbi:MAG TPA: Hsp20/alpha crystallin family protein [Thermodesulfovibrionales bacterium]|nr:Hsp20/alpha crystallin family protein [Thermodesulfovibrionales bacterium]